MESLGRKGILQQSLPRRSPLTREPMAIINARLFSKDETQPYLEIISLQPPAWRALSVVFFWGRKLDFPIGPRYIHSHFPTFFLNFLTTELR